MCGFAGIIKLKGLERSQYLENKMSAAQANLHSRGPNQKGKYVDSTSYLVHTRLSIIDISDAGKQPMEKYNKVLVFNGEIYNFLELKNELQSYGYVFSSLSDSEVLIASWDKWGRECLTKIKGMFSFAIWDKRSKELFLARDPYGKKPLVYSFNSNFIAFASDLKTLENIIDCGEINPKAIDSLFRFRFIHDPLTIYKNAYKLPPGHLMIYSQKTIELKKWYYLPSYKNLLNDKELAYKKLKELFDVAVNRRLISDVPVGLLLSGGLDSSLILASLAGQGSNLPCFTMGFKSASDYYEERPEAVRLAKYYGMEHFTFEVSSKQILNKLPDIWAASDEPYADTSSIPFYFLSQEVKKNVTVALSGDGGDEIFGGYRKYMAERWVKTGLIIPKSLRKYIAGLLSEDKDTKYGEVSRRIRRFLLNISKDDIKRQISFLEQLDSNTITKLFGFSSENKYDLISNFRKGHVDPINSMLSADLGFSLSGDMLVKVDRMSMANSLEIRSPFLDKDLVEFSFQIPGFWKVGTFKGKKILRSAFSDRVPDWSINLPKKGFEVPIAKWLKSDLKNLLFESTSNKKLEKLGFKNTNIIESWKKDLFKGKRDTSWKLWTLIAYERWASSKGIT